MHQNKVSFIAALALISLISSCAKEGPTGPTGPAGPGYTGSISGHVSLYDKYGNKVLTGLDSTSLTLTGSSTSYTGSTSSDASGFYNFANTYTGDYTLVASRNNYATTELINFAFLAGSFNKDVKLSAIPDSFITSFTIVHSPGSLYDSLAITTAPDPMPRNVIVFANSNVNVNNNDEIGYILSYTHTVPANATTTYIVLSQQELINAGFTSGVSEIYFAAYSYVVNDGSVYEDAATGRNVYNAVNANPIIDSVLAP